MSKMTQNPRGVGIVELASSVPSRADNVMRLCGETETVSERILLALATFYAVERLSV